VLVIYPETGLKHEVPFGNLCANFMEHEVAPKVKRPSGPTAWRAVRAEDPSSFLQTRLKTWGPKFISWTWAQLRIWRSSCL